MAQGNGRSEKRTRPDQAVIYQNLSEAAMQLHQVKINEGSHNHTVIDDAPITDVDDWTNLINTTIATTTAMDTHPVLDTGYMNMNTPPSLAEVLADSGITATTMAGPEGLFSLVPSSNPLEFSSDIMATLTDSPLAFLTINEDSNTLLYNALTADTPQFSRNRLIPQAGLVHPAPGIVTVTSPPVTPVTPVTVSSPVGKVPIYQHHSSYKQESGTSSPDYSSHTDSAKSGSVKNNNTTKRKRKKHQRANSPPESPCRTPTERSPTHTPPNSPLTRSPNHSGPTTPLHSPYGSSDNLHIKEEMKGSEKLPRHKRPAHMRAETKRRDKIQHGLSTLQQLVPKLTSSKEQGGRESKAVVLQKSGEFIRQLRSETKTQQRELRQLDEDIQKLSKEIDDVQDALPEAGFGSTQAPPNLQKLLLAHRTRWLEQDWRYGIFLMLTHDLKEGYPLRMENVNTYVEFKQELNNWLLQDGSLAPIRASSKKTLRSLSTQTSIMTDPSKFPQEIVNLIKTKRAEAEKTQNTSVL